MLVELDIFSGRPNPCWELDEIRSREVLQLQSRLQRSSRTHAEPPGLGYKGFCYSDGAGRVRVYHGFVLTARAVLADPCFTVERYLMDHIPEEFAALRKRISSEISCSE